MQQCVLHVLWSYIYKNQQYKISSTALLPANLYCWQQCVHSVFLVKRCVYEYSTLYSACIVDQRVCAGNINIEHENCSLLGYDLALSGNPLPTFRDNVLVPSSRVKKSKKITTLSTTHYSVQNFNCICVFVVLLGA
jgi:hypothetical protein